MPPKSTVTVDSPCGFPLHLAVLCGEESCEWVFEFGPERCPKCGSVAQTPVARFIPSQQPLPERPVRAVRLERVR